MFSWVKALLVALGIIKKAEDLIHDHNVEVGGENKIIADDNAKSAQVAHDATQALIDSSDQSVSDDLRRGRF